MAGSSEEPDGKLASDDPEVAADLATVESARIAAESKNISKLTLVVTAISLAITAILSIAAIVIRSVIQNPGSQGSPTNNGIFEKILRHAAVGN